MRSQSRQTSTAVVRSVRRKKTRKSTNELMKTQIPPCAQSLAERRTREDGKSCNPLSDSPVGSSPKLTKKKTRKTTNELMKTQIPLQDQPLDERYVCIFRGLVRDGSKVRKLMS
jgi:hypothetical protein